jgi:hypothetical protein
MCNLYSATKGQAAIVKLTRAMIARTGDLPPLPGIFPDYGAPINGRGRTGGSFCWRGGACLRRYLRLRVKRPILA